MTRAEGKGLEPAAICNVPIPKGLQRKLLPDNNLPHSGCSRLVPVIPGCAVTQTGQNRDKSSIARFTLMLGFAYLAMAAGGRSKVSRRQLSESSVASYARYSSDNQDPRSIADQQRKCRDRAAVDGLTINPHLEFADEAVSGASQDRAGLRELRKAVEQGHVKVLYMESLSRLSRDHLFSCRTLVEFAGRHNVRIVAVDDGIDTSQGENWELTATIYGLQNQQFLRSLSKSVRRGMEGAIHDGYSVGDWVYGYTSEPAPADQQRRLIKNTKPLMVYVIHEEESKWVRQIFRWYAEEGRSITWITRELNRLQVDTGRRGRKNHWYQQRVNKLLKSPKHIGEWLWGEYQSVRDPLTGKKGRKARDAQDLGVHRRHFPELAIIDNDLFQKAQKRLKKSKELFQNTRKANGEFGGSTPRSNYANPRHLLQGLIVCGDCCESRRQRGETPQILYVGGKDSNYLFCPGYKRGECTCQTALNRELAKKFILEEVTGRLFNNPSVKEQLYQLASNSYAKSTKAYPAQRVKLERQLQEAEDAIESLIDRLERGPDLDIDRRLKKRQLQRDELRAELKALEGRQPRLVEAPTGAWIDKQLENVESLLRGDPPAAAHVLRRLIPGKIAVYEVHQPGRKRHYLRGKFKLCTRGLLQVLDQEASREESTEELVEIDFQFNPVPVYVANAEQVKKLLDQGLLVREIARQLGIGCTSVQRAFAFWHTSRDLPVPYIRDLKSKSTSSPSPEHESSASIVSESP